MKGRREVEQLVWLGERRGVGRRERTPLGSIDSLKFISVEPKQSAFSPHKVQEMLGLGLSQQNPQQAWESVWSTFSSQAAHCPRHYCFILNPTPM